MTRKRSFLAVVGAALLLAMPSWAAAQTQLPEAGAIAEDTVMVDAGMPAYSALDVTWTIADGYRLDCIDVDTPACTDNRNPLTHFVVYYSNTPGFNQANADGSVEVAPPGRSASNTAAGKATIKGLMPETRYYIHVAAKNSRGIGPVAAQTTQANETTAAAPKPEQVARVEVTPGDMKLMVSWDEPRPDKDANRTDHVIVMYHVQYRKSQSSTNQPGDWMPTKPMEVMGDDRMTEITGLMNGEPGYDVQVRAVNDATGVGDWSAQSSTTSGVPVGMTPTPALPLVGAFGLGFGLLAAGRARLRRRAQLQLTTPLG